VDRDERLQGEVDMTVDDILRLLGEGGGLDRLSGDAWAIALLLALLLMLPLLMGTTLRRFTLMLLSILLDLEWRPESLESLDDIDESSVLIVS
jgi:hypothetical protein